VSARRVACWRAVALGAAVIFLLLSVAATQGPLPGDPAARVLVKAWTTPAVRAFAHVLNFGGTWMVLLPATALLFAVSRHARRRWWLWCFALTVAPMIENAWKGLIGRARPESPAYGFPSGHATAAAVFVIVALYLFTRAQLGTGPRVALAALVVLGLGVGVGGARLALDAHWASDVLGGWLLGAACGGAAAWWDAARDGAPTSAPATAAPLTRRTVD
jgi:undecaprenyl-diphosphatase